MFMFYPFYLLSSSASVIDFLYFPKLPPVSHRERGQTRERQFPVEIKHVIPLNTTFLQMQCIMDGELNKSVSSMMDFSLCDP